MKLSAIAYLVRDYDEAIAWFTSALGFSILEGFGRGRGCSVGAGQSRWARTDRSDQQSRRRARGVFFKYR